MKASKREPKLDNKSANQEQIFGNDKKNNRKDCRSDTKLEKSKYRKYFVFRSSMLKK